MALPLGLYIHIPFCRRRCAYCDFNTYAQVEEGLKIRYQRALVADLRASAASLARKLGVERPPLGTLYVGGGTPTSLPISFLVELLEEVRGLFQLSPRAELSLESNPVLVERSGLCALRQAGYNRLSLGVQSLEPSLLKLLGRIHGVEEVEASVAWAREAGFENLNLDLIYGLPTQTLKDWERTLAGVLSLKPQHISAYALSVEEGTPLAHNLERGLYALPTEEEVESLERALVRYLRPAGFRHYEISNWGRPGYACRHNLLYWATARFWGGGGGAVSYLGGWRFKRRNHPAQYLEALERDGNLYTEAERLGELSHLQETLILGLRRQRGITWRELEAHAPPAWRPHLRPWLDDLSATLPPGLLVPTPKGYRLTGRGRDLSNEIFTRLFF